MGGDWAVIKSRIEEYEFQSTPPHGGRHPAGNLGGGSNVFQSTPPHGGRPATYVRRSAWRSFNPRPHMGGDLYKSSWSAVASSFNPRPHMGGDFENNTAITHFEVSIHAPTWGATGCHVAAAPCRRFQSTPPHGGRRGVMAF